MAEAGKKKKRVIRRRKKGAKRNLYFHSGTHDAIKKYQGLETPEERHEVYIAEILPAFEKLAENLIFIHGFTSLHSTYEDLKNDCVTFLYETLDKFDPDRGTKAFSYFNVVAKNWLIIMSKKKVKRNKKHVSMSNFQEMSYSDQDQVQCFKLAPPPEHRIRDAEKKENLFKLLREIQGRLSGENEKSCIDAIITLFTHIEDLDLLNKRAVFVYMRELSGLNPKQLSMAMSVIRKHYKELVKVDEFDIF